MTNNDIAWLSGFAITLISAIIMFIMMMTEDYPPIERRARRLAILASVVTSAMILGTTAAVYFLVSELIGNFLMFPSIGLTAIAVWHASKITYRKMGGGLGSAGSTSQGAGA